MKAIRIPKNILGKKLAGEEWVFLNLSSGVYYGLNPTGSLFWDELAKDGDASRAVDRLSEIFDAERARIGEEMKVFVRELEKEGIIEKTGAW